MMNYYYGSRFVPFSPFGGFGWILGFLFFVLFILLIAGLIKWYAANDEDKVEMSENDDETALAILKKRYAKGEITKREFDSIKKDIQ